MKYSSFSDFNTLLKDFKNNANAVIALAAVIFILDGATILRWQFTSLGRLFSESAKLTREIKTTDVDSKLSPTFKIRLADLQNEIETLNKMVIKEERLPSVIESISKYANLSNVKLLTIKPLGVVASATAPVKSSVVVAGGKELIRERISMSGRSGFHQLGRFVAFLESAPVFLDITNLEIRTDAQDFMHQSDTIILEVAVQKD